MVSTAVSGFAERRSRACSGRGIRVSKLLHVNTPRPRRRSLLAAASCGCCSVACCFSACVECWGGRREGGWQQRGLRVILTPVKHIWHFHVTTKTIFFKYSVDLIILYYSDTHLCLIALETKTPFKVYWTLTHTHHTHVITTNVYIALTWALSSPPRWHAACFWIKQFLPEPWQTKACNNNNNTPAQEYWLLLVCGPVLKLPFVLVVSDWNSCFCMFLCNQTTVETRFQR